MSKEMSYHELIVKDAIIKAKELYDRYIVDDQTKSIAIVELARLIIEENRRGK